MTAHDWDLWTWWSATRGTPPIPAQWDDLQAFLVDVPCAASTAARRISTIRAAHARERTRITGQPERPTPLPLFQRSAVGEVLHTIPVQGFPHGFRGRRDALIIVATSLGMTPAQVAGLTPADVTTYPLPAINGHDLNYDPNHGLRCPACTLTRWLRALSAWYTQLYDAQWRALELLVEDTPDQRPHPRLRHRSPHRMATRTRPNPTHRPPRRTRPTPPGHHPHHHHHPEQPPRTCRYAGAVGHRRPGLWAATCLVQATTHPPRPVRRAARHRRRPRPPRRATRTDQRPDTIAGRRVIAVE